MSIVNIDFHRLKDNILYDADEQFPTGTYCLIEDNLFYKKRKIVMTRLDSYSGLCLDKFSVFHEYNEYISNGKAKKEPIFCHYMTVWDIEKNKPKNILYEVCEKNVFYANVTNVDATDSIKDSYIKWQKNIK